MITDYPFDEHAEKAIQLTRVQRAWLRFVRAAYETALAVAQHAAQPDRCTAAVQQLREAGQAEHAGIRDALDKAYFHYPHDHLSKLEFIADPQSIVDALAELPLRVRLTAGPDATRYVLRNVASQAVAAADSNYAPSHYGPQYTIDGLHGDPSRGVWVSAETTAPHWLQIALPQPQKVRGLVIQWVRDATRDWVPRDFHVRVFTNGVWQTVSDIRDNREPITVAALEPPAVIETVRIEITRGSPSPRAWQPWRRSRSWPWTASHRNPYAPRGPLHGARRIRTAPDAVGAAW